MNSVGYNPAARFDVEMTDRVYLDHESGSLEATIYQPQGQGPFPGLLDVHGGRWFLNDRSDDHPMNLALVLQRRIIWRRDFSVKLNLAT